MALGHEIAGFRHARMAQIGGIGEHRREDRTWFIRGTATLQMREALAEPGPSIDFGKKVGDADRGQMRIERRKGGIGYLGSNRLQGRNPQPAQAELHVFQRVRLRLSLDLGQSTGEAGASFGQPDIGRIRCRYRQGAGRAHVGEYGGRNELLLDSTIASASLDPHVAGAKPVAKLDQHAQFIDPAIGNAGADRPTPSLPDEADWRACRQFAQMTKMKVAHDRDRSRERMAGWHRPECERGDERGTDLSEDGVIGRGDRDGIDRIGADQLAGFIDLAAEIIPSDRCLDRSADIAT